tara:strand:- start:28588 stop:29700 length:1113 start_codon:yes stop_codon:yes gene_type:complete
MKSNNRNQIIFFLPLFELGGVEKNFFLISNYISTKIKCINFHLITFEKTNLLKKNLNKKIKIILPNSNFFVLSRRIKFIICMYELFFKCLNNPKACIFSFQGNFYALVIAIILRRKIIVRSNISPEYWSKNYFKKKIFKFLLSKSNLIIVNSIDFNKRFKKIFNLKPVTIHNPIYKEKNLNVIKNNFFKKNTINLINIGRLVKQKNQSEIIEALSTINNVKNFRLLILGNGPEKNNLMNLIRKKHMNSCVKIISSQNNKNYYLKKSDIFVLSSLYEGFPNVLLEAAINKKYIISSDCPTGPRELINAYKFGELYKTNSVVNLNKIFKRLFIDKEFLKQNKKKVHLNSTIFNSKYNLEKYRRELTKVIYQA